MRGSNGRALTLLEPWWTKPGISEIHTVPCGIAELLLAVLSVDLIISVTGLWDVCSAWDIYLKYLSSNDKPGPARGLEGRKKQVLAGRKSVSLSV